MGFYICGNKSIICIQLFKISWKSSCTFWKINVFIFMTCLKGLFYYCYEAHDLSTVAHCLPKEDDSPAYFLKETLKQKVESGPEL